MFTKKCLLVLLAVFITLQGINPLSRLSGTIGEIAYGGYTHNDNTGKREMSFLNPEGIYLREGLAVSGGVLFLGNGVLTGRIISSHIEPASMRYRNHLALDTTNPSGSKVAVSLLDCDTEQPLAGWNQVPYGGTPLSLTGIDKTTYACLQVQIDMERNNVTDPSPILSLIDLDWQPFPILVSKVRTTTANAEACNTLQYQVNFSNNYVNDMGVVVYVPLPRAEKGTITGYDESLNPYPSLNPIFVSAQGGGKYTATEIMVNGKTIPAESVYRDIGVLNAGETRLNTFSLTIPCDTMNGTKYLMQSKIEGTLADPQTSAFTETTILAQARPQIRKSASGVFNYAQMNYLYLPYNTTLTYTISASNSHGTELINKPVVTEDLSDISQKLGTACGGSVLKDRVSAISDGGVLSGTKITWNLANIGRNETKNLTYKVDFSGCSGAGTTFVNTATLSAKNIPNPLSASYNISLLTVLSAGIQYFKTIAEGEKTIYYGDIITYQLHLNNVGPIRLEEVKFDDVLPPEVELVSADIVSAQGGNVTVSGNALHFDFSGCVNSQYFPTPTTSYCYNHPTVATAIIKAKIKTPTDACKITTISNTASYDILQVSTSHLNNDSAMTGVVTSSGMVSSLHGEWQKAFYANPLKGQLSLSLNGSTNLQVKEKGSYTLTVANQGRDTSLNTKATILVPKLTINGVEKYVSIINVEGGVVDYSDISQGKIYIYLEEVLAGKTKQVKFGIGTIPSGIAAGTKMTIGVVVQGEDDTCGTLSASKSMITIVEAASTIGNTGPQSLYLYKTSKVSYLLAGMETEYQMVVQNIGAMVTSDVYVVDIIPAKSSFVEAYTTATTNAESYSCTGCQVFFSKANENLPKKFDPSNPFTPAMIQSYFTKGTENNGVRTSPYGKETKYVAYLVDDTTKSPPILPTGGARKVGITLKDEGTKPGALLTNSAAVFSQNLGQSISVPKGTTVLEYPGLRTSMSSDKENVNACETFNWDIDYNHDGTAANTITTLTVRLPNTVSLASTTGAITHRWNALTVSEGGLPSAFQSLDTNSNMTVSEVNGETVITVNVNGVLGDDLQPNRGGTLRINTKANCNMISDTIMMGTVVGYYENMLNFGTVGSEDAVHIKNPDLYLRKAVDRKDPLIGEDIAYTLTIANKGQRKAEEVIIQDYLPEGICYNAGSTLVLDPMFWEIGEPYITGDCLSGGQLLTWSNDYDNALTFPGFGSGTLGADSEDIYLRYVGNVQGTVALGVSLINGAKVTTSNAQDNLYDKEDEQEIAVPYPNLYVDLSSPLTIEGGSVFDYTITYGNASRMCAEKPSIVFTLPASEISSGTVGVTIKNVTRDKSEQLYSYPCPYLTTPPTFDWDDPLSGGWLSGKVDNACYFALQVPESDFCTTNGQRTVVITTQASEPQTALKLPAGTAMTATAEIFNLRGEGNTGDNVATSTTKVPAMDLRVTMEGTPEGLTPGLLPNELITYHIEFGNQGSELSCNNFLRFEADKNVNLDSFSFSSLSLVDEAGLEVLFRDPQDTPLGRSTPVTQSGTGGTLTFGFGGDQVCIPGGARGSLYLFARTLNNLPDATPISTKATIWEESLAKEDTMKNNEAVSSTMVYLADVTIEKSAIVDSNSDGIFGAGDSTTAIGKGKTVQYTLRYANIGNYSAKNVVISDSLPEELAFEVGSISLPASGTVEYSKDKGMNRNYISNKVDGDEDEDITDVRILLNDEVVLGNSIEGQFIYPSNNNIFTGNTTWIVPAGVRYIDVFAVGGGGGGGTLAAGGGGGGGYTSTTYALPVTPGETLTINIGAGGQGGIYHNSCSENDYTDTTNGRNGEVTKISRNASVLASANGGEGGKCGGGRGGNGGSGGGSGAGGSGTSGSDGGSDGSDGSTTSRSNCFNGCRPGSGQGTPTRDPRTNTLYAGGGGGARDSQGGAGGGGIGGTNSNAGGNGVANSGGGGGGTQRGEYNGGNGGNGIMIINYALPEATVPAVIPSSTGLQARNTLLLDYQMDAGESVVFELYDTPGMTGNPLLTRMSPETIVDLSNLTYTGTLYVQAKVQGMVTLKAWKATYFSEEKPEITFRAKVKGNKILPNEIINRASISTTTPEIETNNNSDSHTLYTETTDLVLTKTVDSASAAVGDELTYTITYENKGPKDAQNVLIVDSLPQGLDYISSSPQLTAPSFENGYRRLEYTTDSRPNEISFEFTDGSGNVLAQKTQSTYSLSNTTLVFTGQLTVDGPISLSRRDSLGDGDGSYKLYLDGGLVLDGPTRPYGTTITTETKTYTGFVSISKGRIYALPHLPVGSGGTITLKAEITTGTLGQTYANLVTISSDTIELNETDNTATATTTLGTVANLYTTASITQNYTPNATLDATITYGNDGSRTASGAELRVEIDPNVTLLFSSLTGGKQSGNSILWTLGDVAQQSSGSITLQLQVANSPLLVEDNTPLILTSTISTLTSELNLTDNLATAQTLPLQGGTLTLEGHVYIDVDTSYSLTDGDTKLQGQTVARSGVNATGEVQTDVDGKYQIINLEPGYYELNIVPTTGYEATFSKGGKNLTAQLVGSGSLEGHPAKNQITTIRGYAEDTISELDFGLDNKTLTNVATKISLAGVVNDEIALDVEYGNTSSLPAQGVLLQVKLDPNVIYTSASNTAVSYDASGHLLILDIGTLNSNHNHFTVTVELDKTKLTGDTIRYHAFNFVSTISTSTLPEITMIDNISSIDQRLITVGDIYGKVYRDKDQLLGRNPTTDQEIAQYTVELRDLTGSLIKTAITSVAGEYSFMNIKPGTYHITIAASGDYHNFGAFVGVISGTANPAVGSVISDSMIELEVQADTIYTDNDFSLKTLPSALKGTITLDTGLPLQSIAVTLTSTTGSVVKKTYTDAGGDYVFTGLFADEYRISYTLPTTYLAKNASVGTLGGNSASGNQEIEHIVVGFDQNGEGYDFTLEALPQQIEGVAYIVDKNGNFLSPASGMVIYLHTLSQTAIFAKAEQSLLDAELPQGSGSIATSDVSTGSITPEDEDDEANEDDDETDTPPESDPEDYPNDEDDEEDTNEEADENEETDEEIDNDEDDETGEEDDDDEENDEEDEADNETNEETDEENAEGNEHPAGSEEESQIVILEGEMPHLTLEGQMMLMPYATLDTTITDAQGNFSFGVTEGGTYYISHFTLAPHSAYDAYPGKNPDTGLANAIKISTEELEITLATGDSSVQNIFAVQSPATSVNVGVYRDVNENGYYQYDVDQLLSGVVVRIVQGANQLAAGLTTTAGYLFSPMLAGSYEASYVLPNGYLSAGASSKPFTLAEGEHKDIYLPVRVKNAYDLEVEKSVNKLIANPGDLLTYTITVNNLGNTFEGKNILVRDTLQEGLTYVNSNQHFVSYEDAGDRVFKIPSLPAGTTETISFQVQVPNNLASTTTYTNSVRISSSSPTDSNPLNDTAEVSTTVNVTSGGGGGGGGGNGGGETPSLKKDYCPNGDNSPSYYDGECDELEHGAADECSIDSPNYTEEEKAAYRFACEQDISAMNTIQSARLYSELTRAEMAKIVSVYAKNILGKEIPDKKPFCKQFNDADQVNKELQGYIISACELDLMGYWADGISIKSQFKPNDKITRAEVGIIISRMIRGTKYAGTEPKWYQSHLEALQKEGVMNYIEKPMMRELRGNVFIVLQRLYEKGYIKSETTSAESALNVFMTNAVGREK